MDNVSNIKKLKKAIPYAVITICFIILLIRGFYSFCWTDEAFYFSTADRFYKGDVVFLHDWFPTQLSSLFILPLYTLFVKITGSVSGVILFFRIVYAVMELIYGIIIYKLISDIRGSLTALTISLFAMFYTHLNIATVSYYTMSVMFYLIAMILIYRYYRAKGAGSTILVIAGICFALSVLNLPTLAIAYFFVVFLCLMLCISARLVKKGNAIPLDKFKLFSVLKYTLAGIAVPAAVFIIYLLTKLRIPDLINSIPYILSDDEHITSKIYPIKKMYLAIIEAYGGGLFYFGCFITFLAVISWLIRCLSGILLKNQKYEKTAGFIKKLLPYFNMLIMALNLAAFLMYFYKSLTHTGYVQTAIMMFALPIFLISRKKDYPAFIIFFVSGIIFSLVFSYSSNGMLYVLSLGHFISSVGGIIFIRDFIDGLPEMTGIKSHKRYQAVISLVLSLCIFVSLINTISCRIFNVYRDDRLSNLTEVITDGPAKGLKTTPGHKKMYDDVYDVLLRYCQDGNLLISKLLPWGYMCTDKKAAAPSTWRNRMDSERLMEYYRLNPDRYPDTILVLNEYYCSYETCGDVEKDPAPNENSSEGFVYDYISDNNFKQKEVPCGTLYTKLSY